MNKTYAKRWALQLGCAVLVFLSRIGVLPPNYSPLGSFGFFSGNVVLFFGIILAFDYFVGGFYPGFLFTYLGFSAYFFLGKFAKRRIVVQALCIPLASLLFFLLSNLGVWLYWYPRTYAGLLECYTLAVPFFKNTLLGDIGFGYSLLLLQRVPYKKIASNFNLYTALQRLSRLTM